MQKVSLENLKVLNRRACLITLLFGLNGEPPLTLQAIGKLSGGVTKEAVRQMKVRALGLLRESEELREFLEWFILLAVAIPLHDVGLFYSQNPKHDVESAEKIKDRLLGFNLTPEQREKVYSSIASHHDYSPTANQSPEAKALRALDTIDAFGAMGVYRYLEIYTRREPAAEPKDLFVKAMANMKIRYDALDRNIFKPGALAQIATTFNRGQEILGRMIADAEAGRGEGLQVFNTLKGNSWDLRFLNRLESLELGDYGRGVLGEISTILP